VTAWADTVLGSLQDTIADLRGLHEEFGTRRYRVFLVWEAWSGSQVGSGEPSTTEHELLPVPDVMDEEQLRLRFASSGAYREGEWRLREIGPVDPRIPGEAITAQLLAGQTLPGENTPNLPANVTFRYELRPIQPGARTLRMKPSGDPYRTPVDWGVSLTHLTSDGPGAGVAAW